MPCCFDSSQAIRCVLAGFLLSLATSAQVLWTGDFEDRSLSQWSGSLHQNGAQGSNIEVVRFPSKLGHRAARLTIHPDDLQSNEHNRVEVRHDGLRTAEG